MRYLCIFFCVMLWISCKEPGCTDPIATNFDIEANKDDDSCEYNYPVKINFSYRKRKTTECIRNL